MNNFFRNLTGTTAREQSAPGERTLYVNKNRCPENHPCPAVRVCPTSALSQNRYAAPVVDMEKCVSCGKCVRFCPMGAIQLVAKSS